MATPKNVSKALDAGQRVKDVLDRKIRGQAASKLSVEPPILSPGVDPATLPEIQQFVNEARARMGLPPVNYQGPNDNVSRIRFTEGTVPEGRFDPAYSEGHPAGPEARADSNLGHGTSQLQKVPTEDGSMGWAQKTAIEQLMEVILHQKSTARTTNTGLQYDPKTGQRVMRSRGREVSDGGRAHALLESLFHDDPMFAVRIKDEFEALPDEGKDVVYRAIAEEFPNERTSATEGGGRNAIGWSPLADDIVKVLHEGEWNPERVAEVDRINTGGPPVNTERVPGGGGEEAYMLAEGNDEFRELRERELGGTGADEWAPPDPGVVIPPPRQPSPAGGVDDRFIKTDRKDGKSALHSEAGSEVNKPLDKYFSTSVVDIPERLPQDLRTYRAELERLTTQQLLTGKELPGGKMNAVSPNSDMGMYLAKHAKGMSIPEMQALLREHSIQFPETPADLPALSDRSRPTPVRVMDEVPYDEARHLVDPKTHSQIEAVRNYERLKEKFDAGELDEEPTPPRVMARSDRELPAMLAQDRTPQERYDKNLHDFLYSDNDNLRRNALERLWGHIQSKNSVSISPADADSGVNGKTPQERSKNLLDHLFSQASPGFLDDVSDIRKLAGQELMDDHFFTPGRREQYIEDAQTRRETKKVEANAKPEEGVGFEDDDVPIDDGSLPETLASDPVAFNRNEPAPKKTAVGSEKLRQDLAKQDAAQVAASRKRVDRPIADSELQSYTRDPELLASKGIEEGSTDDKYESIRQMYMREFGQKHGAPEGTPNNFHQVKTGEMNPDGTPQIEWVPSPTHLWSTKSRLFAKPQSSADHITALKSGQASPEVLAAAKADANRMRREIALNSNSAAAKAAAKELARLDSAIKGYEKNAGAPAPAGKSRMAELQEKVSAKETPKPKPPVNAAPADRSRTEVVAELNDSVKAREAKEAAKAGPDPHVAMSKLASKAKRTNKEAAALQEYMVSLVNGQDDPAAKAKLDDINGKLEAARKAPAPKKGKQKSEPAPIPADDTKGLGGMSEDDPDSIDSDNLDAASISEDTPRTPPPDEPAAAADVPEAAPEKPPANMARWRDGGELATQDRDVSVPRRPRDVEGEWEDPMYAPPDEDPIDVDFEVHPKEAPSTELARPKRLPAPEEKVPDAPSQRKFPWKALGIAGAGLVGGQVFINALRQGYNDTHVDPFPMPPGGQDEDEANGGPNGGPGGYAPMTSREMQSRKPFHALSPEERIRFLRTRYNQATPSTLTRPY